MSFKALRTKYWDRYRVPVPRKFTVETVTVTGTGTVFRNENFQSYDRYRYRTLLDSFLSVRHVLGIQNTCGVFFLNVWSDMVCMYVST